MKISPLAKYIINCGMLLIFIYLAVLFSKTVRSALFMDAASIFLFGCICGMSIVVAYMQFIEVLTPVIKFVISKIKKKSISFIDVLNNAR